MNNPNSGQDYIGGYPVPRYALEVVHGDYMQSLPGNNGYYHVLVMSCPLSGILMTFPVKSLSSEIAIGIISRFIFPYFTVKTFVSDAGSVFASEQFRNAMKIFNIQKIEIARLAPAHNGLAEKAIHLFKQAMAKYIAPDSQQSWLGLVPFLTRIHNTTPRNKTGLTPLSLLFGDHAHAKSPFELELWPDTKVFMNDAADLEKMNLEREQLVRLARESLKEANAVLKKDRNKNTVKREYKVGDIVFTRNRKYTQGVSPALKTKWSPDPFVVVRALGSSAVIMRIADGSRFYYKNYDIKKPNAFATEELDIPASVKPLLSIPVEKYKDRAFAIIREHAVLDFPYNAIDINNPEEIEAAVEKQARIDPKERALTNPLEVESEEELAYNPDNETDEQTPTDITEKGSEEIEPFEETNDEGDRDDVELTDGQDSRDTNLSPSEKENDLGDEQNKQATDPKIDDKVETDTMPMSETKYPIEVADEFVNKSTRFPTDKVEIKKPSKGLKKTQKRKKKKRNVKGQPKRDLGTRKSDAPEMPQEEKIANKRYKLRHRQKKEKKDDSSEDEEEIKGRKHVTFEDEDPPPKLKIDYGEPVAEIRDIM